MAASLAVPSPGTTPSASRFAVSPSVIPSSSSSSSAPPASRNQAGRCSRGGRLIKSGSNSYATRQYPHAHTYLGRRPGQPATHLDVLLVRIPMLRRPRVRAILPPPGLSARVTPASTPWEEPAPTSTSVDAKFHPIMARSAPTTHPVWCIPSLSPTQLAAGPPSTRRRRGTQTHGSTRRIGWLRTSKSLSSVAFTSSSRIGFQSASGRQCVTPKCSCSRQPQPVPALGGESGKGKAGLTNWMPDARVKVRNGLIGCSGVREMIVRRCSVARNGTLLP